MKKCVLCYQKSFLLMICRQCLLRVKKCYSPKHVVIDGVVVISFYKYKSDLRDLIILAKAKNNIVALKILKLLFTRAVTDLKLCNLLQVNNSCIIKAPQSLRSRFRGRFDITGCLVNIFKPDVQVISSPPSLCWRINKQSFLAKEDRLIKGNYYRFFNKLNTKWEQKIVHVTNICIIDDIVTTGETIRSIVRSGSMGAKNVVAICLAHA